LAENSQAKIVLNDIGSAAEIYGSRDKNLSLIERMLDVRLVTQDGELVVIGKPERISQTQEVFKQLQEYYQAGNPITLHDVGYVARSVRSGSQDALTGLAREVVLVTARGRQVKPKTLGQKQYIKCIRENDIVFSIGPAGTGKTYLAVVMAISFLRNKQVSRLVLTRPAVEAGEKLGFLPGDLQEKVDPYLRPLYDSLYDILGLENTQKYIERHTIEIAPLAYMRGRTLEDAFIILDEAQNTTREQMKMFLTRLGYGSRAVITGDITQIDLPKGQLSGLVHVQKILASIEGIAFHYLGGEDIVRHPLVQEIIKAYEEPGPDEETKREPQQSTLKA
jgi:phosphate starvation-inducible PhoH-like protein